ncbi:MAG: pentapeptide repeat-containing protein [Pseudomonadota bacterium]
MAKSSLPPFVSELLAPIGLPDTVKLWGFRLWASLFIILTVGMIAAIGTALVTLPGATSEEAFIRLRGALLSVAAFTATLGAVVALPFTLVRVLANERQTRIQEEGYVTQQINEAVANLAAQREVNKLGRNLVWIHDGHRQKGFEWYGEGFEFPDDEADVSTAEDQSEGDWKNNTLTEPNIEVRIGAILALERLARSRAELAGEAKDLDEPSDRTSDGIIDHDGARDHVRIMEILCTYVKENSPARTARSREWREGERMPSIVSWLQTLPKLRTDVQLVLRVLGRRTKLQRDCEGRRVNKVSGDPGWLGFKIDLSGCNLQAAKLAHTASQRMHLENADISLSRLEGTDLSFAKLQQTDFSKATLDGSVLESAQAARAEFPEADLHEVTFANADVEYANFRKCRMHRAQFYHTQAAHVILEDADLSDAKLGPSDFSHVHFRGTVLRGASFQDQRLEDLARLLTPEEIEDLFPSGPRIEFTDFNGAAFQNCEIHAEMLEPFLLEECFGDASVCFTGEWPDGYTKLDPNGKQIADTSRNLTHWSADLLTEQRFSTSWWERQENNGVTCRKN